MSVNLKFFVGELSETVQLYPFSSFRGVYEHRPRVEAHECQIQGK